MIFALLAACMPGVSEPPLPAQCLGDNDPNGCGLALRHEASGHPDLGDRLRLYCAVGVADACHMVMWERTLSGQIEDSPESLHAIVAQWQGLCSGEVPNPRACIAAGSVWTASAYGHVDAAKGYMRRACQVSPRHLPRYCIAELELDHMLGREVSEEYFALRALIPEREGTDVRTLGGYENLRFAFVAEAYGRSGDDLRAQGLPASMPLPPGEQWMAARGSRRNHDAAP